MSLDVMVQPLWMSYVERKVPADKLCVGRYVSVEEVDLSEEELPPSAWQRWRARRKVASIAREVEKQVGRPVRWRDEGEEVAWEQAFWGFEMLRAYAQWLDVQDVFPTFDLAPQDNYYNHPVRKWEHDGRLMRFEHLIDHDCYHGYYLPCRFDRIARADEHQLAYFTMTRSVGSSLTLADQLEILAPHIPQPVPKPVTEEQRMHWALRESFDQLQRMAKLSIKHGLPVIFHG
jgi:hypothetical protein